ncbi:MAG: pilus assembly protein [Bryobacteraceae bacterium]|nr:pilus assembly protein [Bryobacteraceae bacterium]
MKGQRGQSTLEFAITFSLITMPLTFAIIFTAQLLWVWHSVVDFTRDGARYATTHCWQGSGENVATYMRSHVPLMIDGDQFSQGVATIAVEYLLRNPDTGQLESFTCDGSECSSDCVPDVVTVRVTGYEFRRVLTYLGIPPVPLPDFRTSLPMESAGCSPDSADCLQ